MAGTSDNCSCSCAGRDSIQRTIREFAPVAAHNVSMTGTARRIVAWWRRQGADRKKRVLLPRLAAASLAVVVGSIVVAKFAWGTNGPSIVTPFAFAGLFFAAVILFAIAITSCEEFVDELEASRPPRVRKRGVVPRALRRGIAALGRALLVWLVWVGTALRREVTRKSAAQRWRDLVNSLSGVPPAGVTADHAGPLARPVDASRAAPAERDAHGRTPRRTRPVRRDALSTLERLYRQHRTRSGHSRHGELSGSGSKPE